MPHNMICVVGYTCGGTSVVAEILEKLGVNMGPYDPEPPKGRDYLNREDTVAKSFILQGHKRGWTKTNALMRTYIDTRIQEGEKNGVRVGFKYPCTYRCQAGDDWKGWPIDVVVVTRDIESVILSNAAKEQSTARVRAAEVGQMVLDKYFWLSEYPPKLTVPYEELLVGRTHWVQKLGLALNLRESNRQAMAAIKVVDPNKRRF